MARLTRAESQAQTRAALREAAAHLVARNGLDATSIEQITERAGFSRGAFYANYSSKEELFAELLQERIYAAYRQMAREWVDAAERPTPRATGARLAELIEGGEGKWLFALWLELLAHAARNPDFRTIAAGFWRRTRELIAAGIRDELATQGREAPAPPEWIASASIALDIGLAIQHLVDPEQVPLAAYPVLFELLFSEV